MEIIKIRSGGLFSRLGIASPKYSLVIMRLLYSFFLTTSLSHENGPGNQGRSGIENGPGGPGNGGNSKEMIVCGENEFFDDCPLCTDSMCDGTPQGGFLRVDTCFLIGR